MAAGRKRKLSRPNLLKRPVKRRSANANPLSALLHRQVLILHQALRRIELASVEPRLAATAPAPCPGGIHPSPCALANHVSLHLAERRHYLAEDPTSRSARFPPILLPGEPADTGLTGPSGHAPR